MNRFMNRDVIKSFIRSKYSLKEKIQKIESSKNSLLKNFWLEKLPEPKKENCVAIDGSYNFARFRSLVFYSINVSAVIFEDGKLKIENFPEFDVSEDFMYFEDMLRSYMVQKEISTALKFAKNYHVMLDGSLLYFINSLSTENRSNTLKELLSTEKLVFSISKTPLKSFEEAQKEGYSKIFNEGKNNEIIYFYFKLRKNSLTYKVETFRKNENRIEEILSLIRGFEIRGYPYLLIRAHREVKISNSDIQKLAKLLGIKEKTGREIL